MHGIAPRPVLQLVVPVSLRYPSAHPASSVTISPLIKLLLLLLIYMLVIRVYKGHASHSRRKFLRSTLTTTCKCTTPPGLCQSMLAL